MGAWTWGKNLLKSMSRMSSTLMSARMKKAMGETTPTTFVRDFCKRVVKIIPTSIMKEMTPALMTTPKRARVLRLASLTRLLERKARNAGKSGRTQTAPRGVRSPKINELRKLPRTLTILAASSDLRE